jgi:hypothetical protein
LSCVSSIDDHSLKALIPSLLMFFTLNPLQVLQLMYLANFE